MHKATAGSLASSFVLQSALVISGVLVARMLGPQNRGFLALLILWPTVIARVGSLGIPSAVPYFLARDPERSRNLAHGLLRPVVLQLIVLTALHAGILWFFLLGKQPAVRSAGLITLAGVPNLLGLDYGLGLLQGQQRFTAFNIFRALSGCLYAGAALALFLLGIGSLVTVAIVLATSGLAVAGGALLIGVRGLPVSSDSDQSGLSKEMVWFGLRGFLGSVSPFETFRLDQAVIGLLLSPAALGLYVVGLAFTNLPRLVAQSVGLVAYPYIASRQSDNPQWRSIKPFLLFSMAVTTPVIILIAATADFSVPFFFGHEFASAIPVTRVLLIGALFMAARRVLSDGARGSGFPGIGTLAEIASWLCLVPGIVLLAPRWGIVGVGAAFTVASAASLIVLILTWSGAAAIGRRLPARTSVAR